ncbi:enoyl-CoA hydratase/isomerase family protein [Achromobacter xylosoxidans]|uniref:enoyl-CoA hydratase/isomerase family protein n=1 Tax=Alcaligenes xylosoxydans xylosoxydans TaxID=85698 RepID=UPI000B495042|nr:enoyl-CoA hydratase-related protein [Achromobacter xylosoxidans]
MLSVDGSDAPQFVSLQPGRIAYVTMQRAGALNAFDVEMTEALRKACAQALQDQATRVLVLRGLPKAFSAGGDTVCMRADPARHPARIIEPLHALINALAQTPIPVIAAVQGVAAGGAVGLALACDVVIAASNARFNLAYARLGASCDCAVSWALPRLLGWRRALHMLMLEPEFDAQAALGWGLVNQVVAAADLEATTLMVAQRLAQGPRASWAEMKRLLRQSAELGLPQQLQAEAEAFARCAASADFSEGLAAFAEKREPVFGRGA